MKECLLILRSELGRIRNKKYEPRTCDIDIIDYDGKIISNANDQNLIPYLIQKCTEETSFYCLYLKFQKHGFTQ